MAKPINVVVSQGEAIELTSGWLDLQQAEPGTVYLLPVRFRRVGELGRYYLVPHGEPTGPLGLEVKLLRLPKLRKREVRHETTT